MATTTVYFDGLCPVCSREVALYRRLVSPDRMSWRDLASGPAALTDESFDLEAALSLLHVRDRAGRLHIGLPAHLVMWDELPVLKWLAALLRRYPRLRRAFERRYLAFTARRPGLRRRRQGGSDA